MADQQKHIGDQLTHAQLARRREQHRKQQTDSMQRVDVLVSTQVEIGRDLGSGLEQLRSQSAELHRLESDRSDGSFLASLVRPFTARRTALARRSVAEELLKVYEGTSVRLREATAFTDELKLCALELQQEVDRLHRELGEALHNQRVSAHRVLEAEAVLVETAALGMDADAMARRRDRYTFDLKTEAVNLELYRVAEEQCRQHLDPARALRDTVLQLHEDMARYVINATHTVNAAGRRIQGLGVMADAPIVVQELQESLDELSAAMEATVRYIEDSQRLVEQILPELSAKLDARDEHANFELTTGLQGVDRARARKMAERALRQAAEREISEFLDEDE